MSKVDDGGPTVELLESGFWHVRWNANQWLQWPASRRPNLDDAFGWVTREMLDHAENLVAEIRRPRTYAAPCTSSSTRSEETRAIL